VTAYESYAGQTYGNVEISAQLLGTWKLWRAESGVDLSSLQEELEGLWITGSIDRSARGLPYLTTHHEFEVDCDHPILDSTAFMLFAYWSFNPFAPGKRSAA
jgi:hypothetical protein